MRSAAETASSALLAIAQYVLDLGLATPEQRLFFHATTFLLPLNLALIALLPERGTVTPRGLSRWVLIGVQVVNGVLLPINLFFIWRLSRSPTLMGERRSRGALDFAAGLTVCVLSCLSLVLGVVTVGGI